MAVISNEGRKSGPAEGAPRLLRLSSLQKWPVIESALGSWSKTIQLCLILMTLGISTAASYGLGFLLWHIVR
jgi:hypothetical protein